MIDLDDVDNLEPSCDIYYDTQFTYDNCLTNSKADIFDVSIRANTLLSLSLTILGNNLGCNKRLRNSLFIIFKLFIALDLGTQSI
jgi:hypothetical protein